MQFKVTVTKRDLLQANLIGIDKKIILKWSVIGSLIFTLAGIFSLIKTNEYIWYHWISALITLVIVSATGLIYYFLVFLLLITIFAITINLVTYYKSPIRKRLPIEVDYKFENNGIESKSTLGRNSWKWDTVVEIKKYDRFLLMKLVTGTSIVIPIKELTESGAIDKLLAIISTHKKLK